MVNTNILSDKKSAESPADKTFTTYENILVHCKCQFKRDGSHYKIGEIAATQGWILYLSIVRSEITSLLADLVPYLVERAIPFKIPINEEVAGQLLDGALGYTKIGKVVSIYPSAEQINDQLIDSLIRFTECFKGPSIITATHLGGNVYIEYGSINPITIINSSGESENYIYNSSGQLIKDEIDLSLALPPGVDWPFRKYALKIIKPKKSNKIKSYRIYAVIKSDAKGQVILAYKKRWLLPRKWFVIKEGKAFMCADSNDRDISHRLKWQQTISDYISGAINTPKVVELFKIGTDNYLVQDYIRGVSLADWLSTIYNGTNWISLQKELKIQILNNLLEAINIIDKLHKLKIVYRDVTPFNFMIDEANKMYLIDLELAYDLKNETPIPPFRLGSHGFMSPEQLEAKHPSTKEDMYGIGGLLIYSLTTFLPYKFEINNREILNTQLRHLIHDFEIVTTIIACLETLPSDRPDIHQVKSAIARFRDRVIEDNSSSALSTISQDANPSHQKQLIERGLQGLADEHFLSIGRIWTSLSKKEETYIANEQLARHIYLGIGSGVSGILYAIAKVSTTIPIPLEIRELYNINLSYTISELNKSVSAYPAGLINGTSGIGIALIEGIKSNFIGDSPRMQQLIALCFSDNFHGLDLETGAAGIGLALLTCSQYFEPSLFQSKLEAKITMIINSQDKEGFWVTNNSSEAKELSWINGTPGIVTFLLCALEQFNTEYLHMAAQKSLNWIQNQIIEIGPNEECMLKNTAVPICPWLHQGYTGIAFTFIKAYEILKVELYKTIAKTILKVIPSTLMTSLFSTGYGLTGIGEIYLEAYRVFNEAEWLHRANWISQIISNCYRINDNNGIYWITDTNRFPSADFMNGGCGLLHFLTRVSQPNKLKFAFLS